MYLARLLSMHPVSDLASNVMSEQKVDLPTTVVELTCPALMTSESHTHVQTAQPQPPVHGSSDVVVDISRHEALVACKTPTVPLSYTKRSRMSWLTDRVRTHVPSHVRDSPDRIHAIIESRLSHTGVDGYGGAIWTPEMEAAFCDFINLLKCEATMMEMNAKVKSVLVFFVFVLMFMAPAVLLLEIVANIPEATIFWLRVVFGIGASVAGFLYKNFKLAQNVLNDVNGSIMLARMARDAMFEMTKPVQRRRPLDIYFTELSDKRDNIKKGKMSFMLEMMIAYSNQYDEHDFQNAQGSNFDPRNRENVAMVSSVPAVVIPTAGLRNLQDSSSLPGGADRSDRSDRLDCGN